MGQFYDTCPQNLLEWIQKQHLFWVATAPLSASGHVNVSPKGAYDCFHVESPNRVWYEDLTGSGNETIAHLRENGRITIMFTAFQGAPRIVRLFGIGTAYEFGTPEYELRIPSEKRKPGSRAVIVVDVHKVGSSCGYAVPYYQFVGNRTGLLEFFVAKEKNEASFEATRTSSPTNSTGQSASPPPPYALKADDSALSQGTREDTPLAPNGMRAYWIEKNSVSIDGLPGVLTAPRAHTMPQNGWSKEREVERSRAIVEEEKAKLNVKESNRSKLQNVNHDANMSQLTRLVVAFALGGLVTATLVRTRIISL